MITMNFTNTVGGISVTTYKDLAYKHVSGHPLLLDLHIPENAHKPVPLVFYIHGGGWAEGTRDTTNLDAFVKAGYAMASLDYRFTNEAVFPAQIEDVKAALRWLRVHADEFQLDPCRFVTWGHSAGAHLASLLGLTAHSRQFDTGENLHVSSSVLGVGSVSAPVNFLEASGIKPLLKEVSALFGAHPCEQKEWAMAANPITHITAEAPPFVIVHGDSDDLVPMQHAEQLHAALQNKGVPSRLVIQKGVNHFNFSHPEMVAELVAFFDSVIHAKSLR